MLRTRRPPRAPPASRASAAPLRDHNRQLNPAIAAAASAADLQQSSPGSCTHPLDRRPTRSLCVPATMPGKSGDFSVVGNPPSIPLAGRPWPHPEGRRIVAGTVLSRPERRSRTPSSNCNRESAAPRVILLPLAIRRTKSTLSIASDAQRDRCASVR